MKAKQSLYDDLAVAIQQLGSVERQISDDARKTLEQRIEELKYEIARKENLGKRGKYRSADAVAATRAAITSKRPELVRLVIGAGVDVRGKKDNLIGQAICSKRWESEPESSKALNEIIKLLLAAGAGVCYHHLFEAVRAGDVELTKLLLEAGAGAGINADIIKTYGWFLRMITTITFWVLFCGGGIMAIVLSAICLTGVSTLLLITAMVICVIWLGWLVDDRGWLRKERRGARFPLEKAVATKNIDMVNLLLEHGADVTQKKGRALWRAAELGHIEIAKLLKAELTRKEH